MSAVYNICVENFFCFFNIYECCIRKKEIMYTNIYENPDFYETKKKRKKNYFYLK